MFKRPPAKIGVALTVKDRFVVANKIIREWRAKLPKGAVLVIIDDGSAEPFPDATYRFDVPVGPSRAKNRALLELQRLGVEHAFLADHDCWPKSPFWSDPYVASREPHLIHGPKGVEIHRDHQHVAYSQHAGGLTYLHLPAILGTVGGFDPAFGFGGGEGQDLSDRIHAAGLTTWRYADVVDSRRLINQEESAPNTPLNHLLLKRRSSARHVPYHEEGVFKPSKDNTFFIRVYPHKDPTPLIPWLDEVERSGFDGIVLSTDLTKLPRGYQGTELVRPDWKVTLDQRWLHYRELLLDRRGIEWAWIVDRLNFTVSDELTSRMSPSHLYAKAENTNVGCNWMKQNHKSRRLKEIISTHHAMPLLNSAVVGGERSILLEFSSKMNTLGQDIRIDKCLREDEERDPDAGDMAAFNGVCYDSFGSRIITDPKVFAAISFS